MKNNNNVLKKKRCKVSRYRNRYWETKEGDFIKIKDMSDTHLLNAFKLLYGLGHCRRTSHKYEWLQDEIGKRKLSPFKNRLVTERDKEKRSIMRDDWLLHCDTVDSMLSGFGYKEM